MMKKLLFSLLLIFSSFLANSQITMTSTSTSNAWSPFNVVNSGATLQWEATNGLIGTITQNVDDPTFDFSANDGSPITITVTNSDSFVGLTRLDMFNDNLIGSELESIDVTNATALTNLNTRVNNLSSLDVTQNIALKQLITRNNDLLTVLDISNNTLLNRVQANRTSLNTISLANNPLLNNVRLDRANLATAELDQIVIDLDNHGLSNGSLLIANNGFLSITSLTAYNNLIAKGWTIDVPAPLGPEVITLTTTSTSNAWSPFTVTNSGATLVWEASNGLIGTISQTIDDPTFDFSANNGSPITITVTGSDGFIGLSRLDFWNDNGVGSEMSSIDISKATALDRLNTRINNLTSLDVSQNIALKQLIIRNNDLLTTLDISTNTELNRIQANITALTAISLANNPLLNNVRLDNMELTSGVLDQILIDLDNHGLSNGDLQIRNNAEGLTVASLTAYNNLIAKGWTIDVAAPIGSEIITLTTTSSSNAWSPFIVVNSGATLEWEATNGLIGTLTQSVDDPTFDFSANDGSPITITITGSDGFVGLSRLDLWNDNGVGSEIATIDLSKATNLDRLSTRINNLTTLDVSENTVLTELIVRNNDLLAALDISTNTQLDLIQANSTIISAISLVNNPLLVDVRLYNMELTSVILDQILIDLDNHGLSNGDLQIRNNAEGLTSASLTAYNNLIAKGWTIDVAAPIGTEIITLTTTSSSNAWSPFIVVNSGAILEWEATNGLIGTLTQSVDDPTFDFSANDGSPITITITGSDGFVGLSRLDLWNDNGVGSEIATIDLSKATNLDRLSTRINNLTTLDVSANTVLTELIVRNNDLLAALDISTNTQLDFIQANSTIISAISLANNPLLLDVRLYNMELTSGVLDQIVIDLDNHGLSNGDLQIRNNAEGLSAASLVSYNNLIAKGWTIDVAPPVGTEIITMTTTSTSNAWSPFIVVNSGATLEWEATNGLIGTLTQSVDDPTFDFSANDGSPITITITGSDGFVGLTRLDLWNDNGIGSEITTIDLSKADALDRLSTRINNLTTLDVSANTALSELIVRNNDLLAALDISTNTQLDFIQANSTIISAISLANNPLLLDVRLYNMELTSGVLDQILIDLDNHGLSNGDLQIRNNAEGLTAASLAAYNSLIAKGWSIDVGPPSGTEIITLTTSSSSNAWSPFIVVNSGATLEWEATNGLIGTITQNVDDPTFDFSANDGTPITITITSSDGFVGLTRLDLWNDNGVGSEISTIDLSKATALERLNARINNFTTLDVSLNTALTELIVRNNDLLATLDISTNVQLEMVQANSTIISTISLANNPLLLDVRLYNMELTSVVLDQIVIDLDTHGLSNGDLQIRNNAEELTLASLTAYNNLIVKGWTIDVGPPTAAGPVIDVIGNGISIANGDTTPDIADDTDFGQVTNNTAKSTTFTIENAGTADLSVTDIKFSFGSDNEFTFDNLPALPATIAPGANVTFDVVFIPTATGNYSAFIEIDNSDTSQDPFQFAIAGEGADIVVGGDIMITQYYNNTTGDNWVEVKNISGGTIPAGTYFLALYDQASIPNISTQAPTASESIPLLNADDVILFDNGAALPLSANLGSVPIITTPVCNFDGDDVILISTTNDATCYGNRQDVVGDVPAQTWGAEISLIRGGSSTETPEPFFDKNKWILLSPSADVDVASTQTNIALGIQGVGPTVWNGSGWDNLDPDKTRNVEISGTYNASSGNINAYNFIVNAGSTLNFDSGTINSIIIDGDLTIDGTFIIGDQESLVMTNNNATVTGNVTKIENSTPRNNTHDFTYWSSPVAAGDIGTVFAGVTPSRIFLFEAPLQVSDPNDPNYFAPWVVASGLMTPGRGYAAEGVTGSTGVHNISFTGAPNNGLVEFDIFDNNDADAQNDYNLIGNPYASAINIEVFFAVNNSLIDPTVYLWTHNTAISGGDSGDFISSDYATYNFTGGTGTGSNPNDPGNIPDKNIGSSQGFFVRAISSGLVEFNNGMRVADVNDQFFKSNDVKNKTIEDEKDRIWLNLISDKGAKNQILIGFTDKATEDVDRGYDALKFIGANNNPIYFYSVIQNMKYVIQGLNSFSNDKSVTLGFDTNVAPRVLSIGIDKTEGLLKNSDIYIVDHLLNVVHDLKKSDYQFEQETIGENLNRFTLQFVATGTVLGIKDVLSKNEFIVSNENENLKIISNQNVSSIRVYDMLGRILIDKNPDKKSFYLETSTIKKGTVLLIEAVLENGIVINKKTIKY